MASNISYVEFVAEQMAGAGTITYRRMFGEYGLYCNGVYFGAVCNDRALVKITPAGEALVPDCPRGIPYEGGAEMFQPDVEDRGTLDELVRVTCAALPAKKPRRQCFVEDMPAMWPVNILFLGSKRIKKNSYPG